MLYHNHKLTASSAPGLTQATPNEYSLIVLACVSRYSGTSCVLYEHLGTNHKCPDYQCAQVSIYDKAASFGTITKCVD